MDLQLLRGGEGWTKVEGRSTQAKETLRISKSVLKKKQEEGVVIMDVTREQR